MAIYGDQKHNSGIEWDESSKLYQLFDIDNRQSGIIETSASEDEVKYLWRMTYHRTEIENEEFENYPGDSLDISTLIALLQNKGYRTERRFVIEVNC